MNFKKQSNETRDHIKAMANASSARTRPTSEPSFKRGIKFIVMFVVFASVTKFTIASGFEPAADKKQSVTQRNNPSYDLMIALHQAMKKADWKSAQAKYAEAISFKWPQPYQELLQTHLLALYFLAPEHAETLRASYPLAFQELSGANQTEILSATRKAALQLELVPAEKSTADQIPTQGSDDQIKTPPPQNKPLQDEHLKAPLKAPLKTTVKTQRQQLQNLRSLWKSQKTHESLLFAQSVTFNKHKRTCQPLWAYSQFVQGQVARRNQHRKQFFYHQRNTALELLKDSCNEVSFDMEPAEYKRFRQSELLWAARLYWENNQLLPDQVTASEFTHWRAPFEGAEPISKLILEEGLAENNFPLVLEAAQVLYGRVKYESEKPAANAEEIKRLLAQLPQLDQLQNAPNLAPADASVKQVNTKTVAIPEQLNELKEYLHFRRSLFLYMDKQFAQCATELQAAVEEYSNKENQLGTAASNSAAAKRAHTAHLYWWAKCESMKKPSANTFQNIRKAWNEIHKLGATGYYAMLIQQDFPSITSDSLETDFRIVFETTPRAASEQETAKKNDAEVFKSFLQPLRNSTKLASLEKKSPLLNPLIEWVLKELKSNNQESHLFTAHQGLLGTIYEFLLEQERNGEVILSAGRIAADYRLDHPKAAFLTNYLYPWVYQQPFDNASQKCSVDVALLYAVSRQESLYNPQAVSSAGARGLLQVMPSVWNALQKKNNAQQEKNTVNTDSFDIVANLEAGACHLQETLAHYSGHLIFALAGYNAGQSVVDSWVKHRFKTDEKIFVEFIPFSETQNYVKQVLRSFYFIPKIRLMQDQETLKAQ